MSDIRTEEQSEKADRYKQSADKIKGENQEKIALWVARAKRHPFITVLNLVAIFIGAYVLLSGKAFDLNLLIHTGIIYIAYRCVVMFTAKLPSKPNKLDSDVTRNDKK
jgi:hypothetical protein